MLLIKIKRGLSLRISSASTDPIIHAHNCRTPFARRICRAIGRIRSDAFEGLLIKTLRRKDNAPGTWGNYLFIRLYESGRNAVAE